MWDITTSSTPSLNTYIVLESEWCITPHDSISSFSWGTLPHPCPWVSQASRTSGSLISRACLSAHRAAGCYRAVSCCSLHLCRPIRDKYSGAFRAGYTSRVNQSGTISWELPYVALGDSEPRQLRNSAEVPGGQQSCASLALPPLPESTAPTVTSLCHC